MKNRFFKKIIWIQTLINVFLIFAFWVQLKALTGLIDFLNVHFMIILFFVQGVAFSILSIYMIITCIKFYTKFEILICIVNLIISILFLFYFYIFIFELEP